MGVYINESNPEIVKSMSKNPIIFACANPDPEIKPELIQYALNYLLIHKWTCLLNIPWLLIDANLFDQFFWLKKTLKFLGFYSHGVWKSKHR